MIKLIEIAFRGCLAITLISALGLLYVSLVAAPEPDPEGGKILAVQLSGVEFRFLNSLEFEVLNLSGRGLASSVMAGLTLGAILVLLQGRARRTEKSRRRS